MYLLLLLILPLLGGVLAGTVKNRTFAKWSLRLTLLGELLLALGIPAFGKALDCANTAGIGLTFRCDGIQTLLCVLGAVLWLVSGAAAQEQLGEQPHYTRYQVFLLLTECAIMGVFLAGDFYTTLFFFEMMSVASYFWVIHNGTEEARKAGDSYLAYAVIGGLVTLMGLFLLQTMVGTLRFDQLPQAIAAYEGSKTILYVTGGLISATFAAKVAMWPVHTWLPQAYPQAPAPATALLSGIVTKAGVFGLFAIAAKLFPADPLWGKAVVLLGTATMLWGGLMALLQSNVKMTLAYSSMSQIGFILVGTGMGSVLGEEKGIAVWGSVLHMTNHALIKLVLFLAVGVIFFSEGKLELTELQGYGRKKKWLLFTMLLPALSVMGVPLGGGYISKTLLHESIVEQIHLTGEPFYAAVEWLFLISGGMTVAYMTKLLVCLFLEQNGDKEVQKHYDETPVSASPVLKGLLAAGAGVCLLLGVTPHQTMEGMARLSQGFFGTEGVEEPIAYFSLTNLKGAAISLTIGAVLYFGVVRTLVRRKEGGRVVYRNPFPRWLNLEDLIYRPVLMTFLPMVGAVAARFAASLFEWLVSLLNHILFFRATHDVHPGEDERFAAYDPDPQERMGGSGTLGFGLTLFGLGYIAIIVYLLVRQFIL